MVSWWHYSGVAHYIANPLGDSVSNPTRKEMQDLLEQVDPEDEEHGAAWLADDDGWSLEWNGSGILVLSQGELAPAQQVPSSFGTTPFASLTTV